MFRADDRAVSEQIGMILVFGFLVVSMATYQAAVVPQANHQVEFKHSQEVRADMMALHAALDRAAATDSRDTVSIALGTQYPQRTFFVNPPNPSGRLSTTDARYVGLINAEADGEAGDFWQAANYGDVGDVVNEDRPPEAARDTEGWWIHPHRGIEYEPNYQATTGDQYTVVDPPGFYSEFDGNVVQRATRSPVEGREIRLLLVNGSLSTASSGTENVAVRPVSADTRTVSVEGGDDDPIILHYPTELPKAEWRAILGEERDPDQENVEYWNYHTNDGQDYVYLVLREENADGERIRYELSLTKVGVGQDMSEEPAAYAVDVAGDGAAVPEGGTQRVVVEVRDAYNGPVSGEPVAVTDSPSLGTVESADGDAVVRTDEAGRATFVYRPDAVDGTREDSFALGFDGSDAGDGKGTRAAERVEFDVEVRDTDGSGSGGGGGEGGAAGGSAADVTYDGNARTYWGSDGVQFGVTNGGGTTATLERVSFNSPGEADELREANGGSGAGQHEIHVASPSDSGRYEAGDKETDRYVLGEAVTLSSAVEVASGESAEFRLRRFREAGPDNSGASVDMRGETLHATLRFADGSERTFEFTVGS